MVKVILIEKNGNILESNINNFSITNLYRKCGLRKNDNFKIRHTWKFNENNEFISIFSKDKGRANSENKYDLPPPVDDKLYFGKMVLVCHGEEILENDNTLPLTKEKWEKYYEKLFGGFEDLVSEEESEEEEIPVQFKTKEGYSKEDGFIVDDDEEEDEDYIPDEEEESDAKSTTEDDEELMGEESDLDLEDDDEDEDEDEDEEEEEDSDIGSELSEEDYISEDDE